MAAVRHPGFFKSSKFQLVIWLGGPICVIMPNAVLIGETVAECRDIVIFRFLGCRPPPSWISFNFKFVTVQTVTRAVLHHPAKFCGNR